MAAQNANRLSRDDLIAGLRDLVRLLHDDGLETSVYIVGGAALALSYDAGRGTTDDIDAKLSPEAHCLGHAAEVGRARGWATDWLNTSADVFIPIARDAGWQLLWSDDVTHVWVASAECLLAMKLKASRRGRDTDDIALLLARLGLTSVEQAEELFESFFPGEIVEPKGIRILTDIYDVGLPAVAAVPERPVLGR